MKRITTPVVCAMAAIMLLFISNNISAQEEDKNIVKAEELVAEAQASSSASERRELYEKALKYYEKAGLGDEANAKIADAMLEVKDYTNAARYYRYAGDELEKEGYMKIGDAYITDAEEDEKKAGSYYNKAVSYYRKAKEEELGYTMIGHSHFNKGLEFYDQAVNNYVRGKSAEDLVKVGDAYYAAGEEYYTNAAYAYSLAGDQENFIKSGDLYFKIGEFESAYAQYDTANYMEGIIDFADEMYKQGDITSANLQYRKVANYYEKEGNTDALLTLAKKVYGAGSYEQAAIFYEKAGMQDKADECELYQAIKVFDLSTAEELSKKQGNAAMTAAINKNYNTLENLKEVAERFNQIKGDEPFVQMQLNETTKKREPNPADLKIFEEHYNTFKGDILGELNTLSSSYSSLTDDTIKTIMRQRFLEYGAVRNIMDNATLKRKLSDSQVAIKDLYM